MKLTNHLEKTFGSLSKTLFFEYQTIAGLAGYFVKAHPTILREKIGELRGGPKAKEAEPATLPKKHPAPSRLGRNRFHHLKANSQQDIAIVGLSGRYPQAENLQEFWRNLQNGRDCITEIPADRWDHSRFYDPAQGKSGKSYSKWGGFIADVDKFDPLFFNVSPKEAALIDPQERLFLQTAWETIEDAGYTKESISGTRVGVFVGVMWGHYELYGAESMLSGDGVLPTSSHASIANRVSYFFDFHGPSIAIDTMCSSSLTAIHLACQELRKGEVDAAIAGGVNVTIHPYKYVTLSQGKFAASDGKCRSFGEGGDGYVPGEGVGAVLLKPLEKALRDGDQIYAIIKSSTVNHGGKTNGYTVPNPNAQAGLILDALRKANIDPKTLSYIETHGTGTSLGDPIEITALMKAFGDSSEEKQFCPIGSVKSNIGHLEAAAGIAAVTKALLQIRYKQLVPSLHADPLNPNINFEDSPFYVQTQLTEWKHAAEHPRRMGVSSFGAGGSNAHLILEEYPKGQNLEKASDPMPLEAFVLSARDHKTLLCYAEKILNFLESAADIHLADIAYTSQIGRTPMSARLAIVTSSVEDLRSKLYQWITLRKHLESSSGVNLDELTNVFDGDVREDQFSAGNLIEGQAGAVFLQNLLAVRDLEKIARLWTLGVKVDWSLMHRDASHKRVSLPTYPFAKERCWLSVETPSPRSVEPAVDSRKPLAHRHSEEKQRTHYVTRVPAQSSTNAPASTRDIDVATLLSRTEEYLKSLIGEEIKLAPDRIGSSDRLEAFGIDSVMISRLNLNLEKDLGPLPKTMLYEHETIGEVARFLLQEKREAVTVRFGSAGAAKEAAVPSTAAEKVVQNEGPGTQENHHLEPIAIIGIHGYYPHSENLNEYWENLKHGRDLVDSVPLNRWDHEEFYHPDPAAAADGKIYCTWGGFLDNYDKFDPQFFNISAEDARIIDPQERLFLQSVWAAIEDAGYTRDSLKKRFPKAKSADVGVFVGVTTNSYNLWAAEERSRGNIVHRSEERRVGKESRSG